ncbi:hypothetical protein BT69DRAFT_1303910 [Atractiella rhizophila]|nr:hypothetical protein BT69DRAFT_1303910 [Atractiella rhizophila]
MWNGYGMEGMVVKAVRGPIPSLDSQTASGTPSERAVGLLAQEPTGRKQGEVEKVWERDSGTCRLSGLNGKVTRCQAGHLLPWSLDVCPQAFLRWVMINGDQVWSWISTIFGADCHEENCDQATNIVLVTSLIHKHIGAYKVWFERREGSHNSSAREVIDMDAITAHDYMFVVTLTLV